MSPAALDATRRHPRRLAVVAVALVVLAGVVVVGVAVTRRVTADRAGTPGGGAATTVDPSGTGPTGGGSGGTQVAGAPGSGGPPDSTIGGTGTGASDTSAGGTSPGGGGPGAIGGTGGGSPEVLGGPSGATGGRVDPPTPVPPREPVRCATTGTPQAASLPPPDERDGRRWVTVGRLAGNCDLSSGRFRLQGIDTRLVWRSDADAFAVFVVDAVGGRDATAGFADGQCAGPCSERQAIVPAPGEYALEVQAGDAPWEVEVQEYRRP